MYLLLAMPKRTSSHIRVSPEITDDEVIAIVAAELPHWKLACEHADADTVILAQQAFGRSLSEIFLMHVAIRYAGIIGKTVMIHPGFQN